AAEAVRRASESAHGTPDAVRIMLATKTQPASRIRVALEAGHTLIGENRVQELQAKAPELADIAHEAHLIGPLQRNKVNHTLRAGAVCVQSIDGLAVAQKLSDRIAALAAEGHAALDAEAPGTLRTRRSGADGAAVADAAGESPLLDVLLQVNTSREDSKSGIAPAAAEQLAAQVRELPHLRIRGLMTIGFPSASAEEIRPSYAELRELSARLRDTGVLPAEATELSMGMSADFALAIEEGATIVRIGSTVFGARE
ncbi:MAG TPA: YggS family pyridoxal phosphate-dependent enzyme, partial [Brevibacterium sp.]|nr:YggS family pyridoxal phosphate-dependent enzyme [Brevibacterium sp.]